MFTDADLISLTLLALPDSPPPARLEAILKGGSDRCFYRLQYDEAERPSVILMTYTLARADNPRFVAATGRLEKLGVRVPKIYAHDEKNLCVWLEDLGSIDLHAFREESWAIREPLYQAALRQVAKLHSVNSNALTTADIAEMELSFDEDLYKWEQNYFLTHYVQDVLKRDTNADSYITSHDALHELRHYLAELPRGLVHRDFQSQNVLIRNGHAWLIDYQGVRPGLAEYDLASLLLDPYVDLADSERDALLKWYAEFTARDYAALRETYLLCAAQRLMQAIGAYANLSRNLGKPHFAEHIPVALTRLEGICAQHPALKLLPRFWQ